MVKKTRNDEICDFGLRIAELAKDKGQGAEGIAQRALSVGQRQKGFGIEALRD